MAALAETRPSANPALPVPTGPQFDNRRVLAGLIDLMVPVGLGVAAAAAGLSLTLGILVVVLGWGLYYCFALESSGGQTLGKRAMKLRVVSADGSPATDGQIAKRTIVRIVEWNIIGLIVMVVSGDRRQRLGDMLAGTVVTDAAAAELPETAELRQPEAPRALTRRPRPPRPRSPSGAAASGIWRSFRSAGPRRTRRPRRPWSPRWPHLRPLRLRRQRRRSPSAAEA